MIFVFFLDSSLNLTTLLRLKKICVRNLTKYIEIKEQTAPFSSVISVIQVIDELLCAVGGSLLLIRLAYGSERVSDWDIYFMQLTSSFYLT